MGSASLKINDDGFYTLSIGAADMGTGCDTILAQIAAEVLDCPLDNVTVLGADTDSSPYDSGSYASSTTYVTGKAVEQCAEQLKQKICQVGAGLLGLDERAVVFAGDAVTSEDGTQRATLAQIAAASQCGSNTALEAVVTHSSEISPPPFMVGAAEVEVDLETGEAQVIRYEAAVDCGTPVNPNLARVQAEGGILQGIGMALTENVTYDDRGMPQENSLMQYKIPARNDIGHIHVVFESSYEGTGPFGAKSIGEVVINTRCPPWLMRSTTPPTSGSMSCPSPASRSRWPGSKRQETVKKTRCGDKKLQSQQIASFAIFFRLQKTLVGASIARPCPFVCEKPSRKTRCCAKPVRRFRFRHRG